MIRYIRDLRLIPIALIASACLLVLKTADLAFHGSTLWTRHEAPSSDAEVSVIRPVPDATEPSGARLSWAQQMFNFPTGAGAPATTAEPPIVAPPRIAEKDNPDITGSVATQPASGGKSGTSGTSGAMDATSTADVAGGPATSLGSDGKSAFPPGTTAIPIEGTTVPTGAERAILERLQQRREELDARARELDIRESLIQGAEKRMDAKLAELKQAEANIKTATQQKDNAAAAQLKGLVIMYENMKPRDAAKIFNGLDSNVLIEVASQINPRQMADIVAQMSPQVAERLTVALADIAEQVKSDGGPAKLPKIDGHPTVP